MKTSGLVACICEGSYEQVIINKLLDEGKLIFSREELLDEDLLDCRSARQFEERYLNKSFSKKITIIRILDSRSEEFPLRETYKKKIEKVINVVTSEEIEILTIINEGKYSDFQSKKRQKHNRNMKPSEYCKGELGFSDIKKRAFVEKYFDDTEVLVSAIKEYKRLKRIPKGECCLCDLLKQ